MSHSPVLKLQFKVLQFISAQHLPPIGRDSSKILFYFLFFIISEKFKLMCLPQIPFELQIPVAQLLFPKHGIPLDPRPENKINYLFV
jgi:hypothetical protein